MHTSSTLVKRLTFSYYSAALIIAILIVCAQIIIQVTLAQEVNTRNYAVLMSRQELRSQRLLRNSILVFAGPKDKDFKPLNVDPEGQLKDDLTFLEAANTTLIQTSQSPDASSSLQSIQNDFHWMDQEGHQILVDQQKKDMKDMGRQISLLFVHEQNYLSGVYSAYAKLSQQADDYVTRVQIIEIVIFCIAMVVLGFEVLGVVRPAIRDYDQALEKLKEVKLLEISQIETPPAL